MTCLCEIFHYPNEEGYKWIGDDYKKKSRLYPREITVKDIRGKEKKILQRRLGGKFSIASIAGSLSKASCTKLEVNWYVQDYSALYCASFVCSCNTDISSDIKYY